MQRIRSRLVLAFVVVALLPAVPLAFLVRDLLERSFAPPFTADAAAALQAALEDQRERLREARERFAAEIASGAAPAPGDLAFDPAVPGEVPAELAAWEGARATDGVVGPERVGDWLVASVPASGTAGDSRRIVARPLPEGLAARAQQVVDAVALLRAFREDRAAVLRSFVAPFLLSYALLLAVAFAVGTVLARRIARPVEALAAGAARVGAGALDTRIESGASGEVGALVDAFNRMVEDLAAQRDELARLERVAAWRDLARHLAHEIKNPLTPIQLAVQQLGEKCPKEGAAGPAGAAGAEYRALVAECVEIVNEEVESLRRLVKEFSEFARLPEPKLEPGDVALLLDEVARLYGAGRAARSGEATVPARFDAAELKRALVNLADNGLAACRAAGRPERVELSCGRDGGGARIRVTDRGSGIAGQDLRRIFEPNFSTKKGSMGLGLAIVEGIVRGHGGTVHVESAVGEGTTFTIRLPEEG
jgi:nitrogen fixation/metabolism regulation signal transduction histidine kinase